MVGCSFTSIYLPISFFRTYLPTVGGGVGGAVAFVPWCVGGGGVGGCVDITSMVFAKIAIAVTI